jgi:hypothetical protein
MSVQLGTNDDIIEPEVRSAHTITQVAAAEEAQQRNNLSGQFESQGGPQFNGTIFEGPVTFGHTTGQAVNAEKCKYL